MYYFGLWCKFTYSSCSILEILLLTMSMVDDWSFMILEWWESMSPGVSFLSFLLYLPFKTFFCLELCSISSNIREGLLEVFYGVYEKDSDKVIMFLFYFINNIMVIIVSHYLTSHGKFYRSAGHSGNDSNGCSCAYWRYDSCQTNCTILP